MAKDRDELNLEGRSAFYAVMFNKLKEVAADHGYALTIHGSMVSDMDLIAIPWVEKVSTHEELVKDLSDALGPTVWKNFHFKERGEKPHGRVVYTLAIYADWYVDLSITPKG